MAWQTPKTDWTAKDAVTVNDLNRIEGNIAELKKAATIDVADVAGNFTSSPKTVENVLNEIAGDVKNGKTAIANAITSMGQSAAATDTFDTLATKIRAISTDATAVEGDVLSGKTFYAGGSKKTGNLVIDGTKFIKSIQSGTSGWADGTVKIPINPVDTNKAIILIEPYAAYSSSWYLYLKNAYFSASNEISVVVGSYQNTPNAADYVYRSFVWKVIEFQPNIIRSIQRGSGYTFSKYVDITISPVNLSKSILFVQGFAVVAGSSEYYIYTAAAGTLINSNTLRILYHNSATNLFSVDYFWQLVEFA
ncbi:hypothetical protein [Caldanaerobacter sp.]|uniref:hypothetical protein n=1 Tax=Caldanaerobacter sp. TaxID=2930036 RepID=UPI003C734C1A